MGCGAASALGHGELPRGGQEAVTWASVLPGGDRHGWGLGENFSHGCLGGVLGFLYPQVYIPYPSYKSPIMKVGSQSM